MNITITPAAEKFIRRLLRFSTSPTGGFRLVVTPGGCSGMAAEFNVEETPRPGDGELVHNGLRIFLPAPTQALLAGVTVDFTDSLGGSGFVFHDPNKKAESCGSSGGGHSHKPVQLVNLSLG